MRTLSASYFLHLPVLPADTPFDSAGPMPALQLQHQSWSTSAASAAGSSSLTGEHKVHGNRIVNQPK